MNNNQKRYLKFAIHPVVFRPFDQREHQLKIFILTEIKKSMCGQNISEMETIQANLDEIKQIAHAIEKLSRPLPPL